MEDILEVISWLLFWSGLGWSGLHQASVHGWLHPLHVCNILHRGSQNVPNICLLGTVPYILQSVQKKGGVRFESILCSWSHGWPCGLRKQAKISYDPYALEPVTAGNLPQRGCKSKQRLINVIMFSAGLGPVWLPGSVTDCCWNLQATRTFSGHKCGLFCPGC